MAAILPVGRIPLLVIVLTCLALSSALGGIDPNILQSDRGELRFDLEIPAPAWRQGVSATPQQQVWEAVLPGFVTAGIPGSVRVPRAGGWFVIPPGTSPRLDVVRETWEPLSGRRLAVEPVPVMRRDEATGEVFETSLLLQPGQALPEDGIPATVRADMARPDPALASGPAVRLGEVSWWRGRRIVSYTVLPVRVAGGGLATESLRGGEWRVRFVRDPAAGKSAPAGVANRRGGKGDERFAGFLLNGELMTALPTEAEYLGRMPDKAAGPADKGTPLGYPDVRLPVAKTQLQRVGARELMSAGLIPAGAGIQKSQIRLYQRRYAAELDDPADDQAAPYVEVEVPIQMMGGGDSFDGDDDYFLFWGLRLRDDGAFSYTVDGTVYDLGDCGDLNETNNEYNIYWLQLADPDAGENWARMEQTSLNASAGSPLTSYRRTDYYNEAYAYRENVPLITMERYYYNTQLDSDATVILNFWAPVPGQTGAEVRAGISNYAGSGRTVLLDITSNGSQVAPLPDFFINVLEERTYSEPLPAAALAAASPQFRMRNSNTVLPLFSYLNWVETEYDALYEVPYGKRLRFPGGNTTGTTNLEIPGFDTDNLGLVEVTDPRNPRFVSLSSANVVADGGSYTLSLQVPQPSEVRQFYATVLTPGGVFDVNYGAAGLSDGVIPTDLMQGSADVIVVTHPEFRERTDQWAEYRRERAGSTGLALQVVEPQQLYDWYSGGLKNPYAIKRLVNHGLDSPTWGTWALVLMGDASENPREIGVQGSGSIWSHDWVPSHLHVQGVSNLPPEVLASDEWYANPDATEGVAFPGAMSEPPDLYVGRFPCNSVDDFDRLFTKIQQVENAQPGEDWRRRGIFIADDAWSSGTLSAEGYTIIHQPSEEEFRNSERRMANDWTGNAGMVTLAADTVWLAPYMDPLHPSDDDVITLTDARNWCEDVGAPQGLIAALSAGGTLAHYQGHANHWLLTHEKWFEHDLRSGPAVSRRDVDELTNVGKPWLFCGMGCHLGDFVQNVAHPSGNVEPGMGEKFLFFTDAGAAAVYASSGYEYLNSNRILSELTVERMTLEPPSVDIAGVAQTSRWMLGEVMWASETDVLAISQSSTTRAMVYQYSILGDPLMALDAGLPEVDAELVGVGGGPIEGELDLVASDASGVRLITLQARDEAGIDRLRVRDSGGADLSSQVVTSEVPYYQNGSRQIIDYELTVPVRPFAHQVTVMVQDSADPADVADNVVVTLNVEQTESVVTVADGEPVDPATFVFTVDEPVDLAMTVASAAWFDDGTVVTLAGSNVDVSALDVGVIGDHTLNVNFTATATEEKVARSVDLNIDGWVTTVELEAGDVPPASGAISGLVNFPNPMVDGTRFTFETGLHSGDGSVRVWTVSGRSVVEVPFALAGDGYEVVEWNGRDREGDQLANGTYLYRVEVESTGGQVRSDMQRLVIMR